MSKYNLSELLTEVAGGRIGTLKISAKELVDKMDDVEARGIDVDRYDGLSPDGKTHIEFHVHPEGRDEQDASFSVYDFKFGFDPMSPEHFMEEYPFSVGGRGGAALRNAQELVGAEPYRMEENKEEIKEDKHKDLINALRFQVMTLEKGIIDKDDFINAVEELAFGPRKAPGMQEEDVIEDEPVTEDSIEEADNPEVDALLDKIRKHLKGSDRNFQDNEIEMYIDSLDRDIKRGDFDGVESISMEDHEEDLENYIADKSLQEHFGRFMKDYQ